MKSVHILIAAFLLPVSVSAAAQDDPEPSTGPVENSEPAGSGEGPHGFQGDLLIYEANIDEANIEANIDEANVDEANVDEAEPADEGAEEPDGSARS